MGQCAPERTAWHLPLLVVVVTPIRMVVRLSLLPKAACPSADLPRLLPEGSAQLLQQQRLPSWRLRVADDDPHGSGDVVVRRADGFIAYQLATVIDELSFGINDVVRGADLREALPAQRSIFAALGEAPPRFRHGPLLCDASGQKLSKREASAGLKTLRDAGLDAAAVIGRLASGLRLVAPEARLSATELLEHLTQQAINAVIS